MKLDSPGSGRNPPGSRLLKSVEFPHLLAEHWALAPGRFAPTTFGGNELAFVLSGRTMATRFRGSFVQKALIQPGVARISPQGVYENGAETLHPIRTLCIRLQQFLIDRSALSDYGVDPAKVELVYIGGLRDPMLYQIALAISGVTERDISPADRLFVDGMQAALAAHLLGHYSIDRWRPPVSVPDLDAKRLKRVLDLIEMRFTEPLSLADLAAEACLSEFHFSRLFRSATGLSPYRYVIRRRVQAAEQMLARTHASLLAIALQTGFGSQASFIRVFHNFTGLTPSEYRALRSG